MWAGFMWFLLNPQMIDWVNYAHAMRGAACYNTVWLLIEVTDQVAGLPRGKAGAALAEEDLMAIGAQIGRCLRQPAVTAAKNVKCHLNQQEVSLFIAEIVLQQ